MEDLTSLPYGVLDGCVHARVLDRETGESTLDLAALADAGLVPDPDGVLAGGSLDRLLAAGRPAWARLRAALLELTATDAWRAHARPLHAAPTLAFRVADYVDFYASAEHAGNVGRIFRPEAPDLPAAWRHLPQGYHGRAGTVVVSGTEVVRPCGLRGPGDHGPSARLDLECEVGFVIGTGAPEGRVDVGSFADHVFGVVLLDDWSARDLQAFEYVPLGPFLGKSFATSVSAWVTPLDALDAAWVAAPAQDPPPYLGTDGRALGLALEVEVNGTVLSRPDSRGLYWTPAQMLAHLTANGAALRTGDLFASGTVSGPADGQWGSLLELTRAGAEPVTLGDGSTRGWLADGDTVTLRGSAPGPAGATVHLGEVTGRVLPARG